MGTKVCITIYTECGSFKGVTHAFLTDMNFLGTLNHAHVLVLEDDFGSEAFFWQKLNHRMMAVIANRMLA